MAHSRAKRIHEDNKFLNEGKAFSQCFTECKRHAHFIPFETFNMNTLSQQFITMNLFKFKHAKALGQLTVKIDVGLTCRGRKKDGKFNPFFYPVGNVTGATDIKSGSGLVYGLKKMDSAVFSNGQLRTCSCSSCQHSGQPNTEFWEIYVVTAQQVVQDISEATNSTVRLFYDKDDSPLVLLDACIDYRICKNIPYSHFMMTFVSCDVDICSKLQKNMDKINKYAWFLKQEKYALKDRHIVTVSHPHGGPKKISIERMDTHDFDYESFKAALSFKACTCPDSSGADVICLDLDKELKLKTFYLGLYPFSQEILKLTQLDSANH